MTGNALLRRIRRNFAPGSLRTGLRGDRGLFLLGESLREQEIAAFVVREILFQHGSHLLRRFVPQSADQGFAVLLLPLAKG